MVDIPESLLRRSAEAKAKALGVPVEQVLAEMRGEAPPAATSAGDAPAAPKPRPGASAVSGESPADVAAETGEPRPEAAGSEPADAGGAPEPAADIEPVEEARPDEAADDVGAGAPAAGEPAEEVRPDEAADDLGAGAPAAGEPAAESEPEGGGVATLTDTDTAAVEEGAPSDDAGGAATGPADGTGDGTGNGAGTGNGRAAAVVSARPVEPPTGMPEGVRTQRLLTVVKARAIQQVKTEPTDKVNTWPHLMVAEFGALLAITALLVVMSVVIQAPLLEPANFNATPNPSKAPWYFLGLQELLSYFDPQIAGVTVPTIIGLIGFMAIPYADRNPSTKPSDRKFAIMLYTMFLAGSATLTILGVLFRAQGFNFAFPWEAGVFFDDLRDWVDFGLH